jgi:hypothetical protein
MASERLNNARKQKADEFYTQLSDIDKELRLYKEQFKGKTVLCNCDDPRVSQFFYFFYSQFHTLGLKRIISTCYKNLNPNLFTQNLDEQAVYCVYDGKDRDDDVYTNYDTFIKQNEWGVLKGDGDFRSPECIDLLKQADIICTNPPFSLFRKYVEQLVEYDKKFLIIGSQNAITYKEIFKLIKENKLWLGYDNGGTKWFKVPMDYDIKTETRIKIENNTKYFSMGSVMWFTNLDTKKRHEYLTLYKKYTPAEYPKYDNYAAIEVGKVAEIPMDYVGVMGVPITFLDKYNPDQFEILGLSASAGYDVEIVGIPKYVKFKDARPLINGKNTYARILIKRRQNEN